MRVFGVQVEWRDASVVLGVPQIEHVVRRNHVVRLACDREKVPLPGLVENLRMRKTLRINCKGAALSRAEDLVLARGLEVLHDVHEHRDVEWHEVLAPVQVYERE